jgi:predicted dehydrogenase
MANLFSSFTANLPTEAEISGDKGRIRLTTRFYEPTATIEYYPGKVDSKSLIAMEKSTGWGYHHEVRHVHDCLRKGLTESPVMSHADSLALMDVLDRIRGKAGIRYPADRV